MDFGAALRRRGHRLDAREPLAAGMDIANRCGATALTQRAHYELTATGARPRRLRTTGRESLTPSERRIAEMAAAGQSSREIAQALFVSTRTVDSHLASVYSKLAIASRKQLSFALTDGE